MRYARLFSYLLPNLSMDAKQHKTLRELVQSHKDHYNVPVHESKLFGIMMAGYRDAPFFYLDAAGEALEEWNAHGLAAVCRRLCNGSLGANSALAAMELESAARDALDVLQEHMTDGDQQKGGCAYDAIQKLKSVLRNVDGDNKDWKFWDESPSVRAA